MKKLPVRSTKPYLKAAPPHHTLTKPQQLLQLFSFNFCFYFALLLSD
jgi:hypothetical protein